MAPTNPSHARLAPDEVRPAATLVILRDTPGGLEVLLTVRPKAMRFMGGAVVFPGGSVADDDRSTRWQTASRVDAATAAEVLGDPDEGSALGFFICALREALEEVDFPPTSGEDATTLIRADAADSARFLARALEAGAVLATDRLVPAGRWVTPLGSPVRFDARFFLARAPEGWTPDPAPAEVAECFWSTPAGALDDLAHGRAIMAPPTIEMLQRLTVHSDAGEAMSRMANVSGQESGRIVRARLSPLVQVVLAPNPGVMTGPGTNTYIVGAGPTCIIDPAVDDSEYIQTVLELAGGVDQILVTHRHGDHVGGAFELARRAGAPVRAFGSGEAGEAAVDPLEDGEVVEIRGGRLRALHTPGHAPDHLCFLFEDLASLFAGDNILGEGTSVIAPPEGNMRAYLASLRRLRGLDLERIYPGHFRPLDGGAEIIDGYLAHREERGRMVLEALNTSPKSVDDVVAEAYIDTPGHLHPVATLSALAHLEMLQEDGAVERDGDLWILRRS